MAKHKGRGVEQKHRKPRTNASKVLKPKQKPKSKAQKGGNSARQQHTVRPYREHDRILLIGEGDFSFARSLVEHHGCRHVTATCLDSAKELIQKYPQAEEATSFLVQRGQRVLHGIDATKLSHKDVRRPPLPPVSKKPDTANASDVDDYELDSNVEQEEDESLHDSSKGQTESSPAGQSGRVTASGPRGWDIIAFNFPHVGGKSTDVNRQVRHNQAMLVSFFQAALPLLTPPSPTRPAGGAALVTLFEGEPYTLWNIKDLGRHAGLRSAQSWKFDWHTYPGYRHARTLGNIEGGGGWKGEGREARTYAFVSRDAPPDVRLLEESTGAMRKRKKAESSEDEDD